VAGSLLPGLRTPAATTASVLVLAALPWPGADVAVPALVVATAVLGAGLAHELAARLAARPVPVRRAAAVVAGLAAAAGALAGVLVVTPDLRPPPAAQPAHVPLAAWIVESAAPDSRIAVSAELAADLIGDGVPAARLGPSGNLVVRVGAAGGPAALARFGSGEDVLSVTPADGSAAESVAAEAPARARAGTELSGNPNLVAPEGVRAVLRAGGVDSRALVLLAGMAGRGPVTVADLPVVAGEDVALPRHRLTLTAVDERALTWLRAQRPPFAPTVVTTTGVTTLTWPLPATPALLG
jgi:hypothetical protein